MVGRFVLEIAVGILQLEKIFPAAATSPEKSGLRAEFGLFVEP